MADALLMLEPEFIALFEQASTAHRMAQVLSHDPIGPLLQALADELDARISEFFTHFDC